MKIQFSNGKPSEISNQSLQSNETVNLFNSLQSSEAEHHYSDSVYQATEDLAESTADENQFEEQSLLVKDNNSIFNSSTELLPSARSGRNRRKPKFLSAYYC